MGEYARWDAFPEPRFEPLGKVVLVVEDPHVLERTLERPVLGEDGDPVLDADGRPKTIRLLAAYDGRERVPAARRGLVVKVSRQLVEDGLRWSQTFQDGFDTAVQDGRSVKLARTRVRRRREPCPVSRGDVVWWCNVHVGRTSFVEDGRTYVVIGAHQIDFQEVPDGTPGAIDPTSIDPVASDVP